MAGPVPEKFYEIGQRFSGHAMAEFDDSRYVCFGAHMRVIVPWKMFRTDPSPEGRGCCEAPGEG